MRWLTCILPALACVLIVAATGTGAPATKTGDAKKESAFGKFTAPDSTTARKQARAWLDAAGVTDRATLKLFDAIWAGDRPLLDRVARTLALGDRDARRILEQARDADATAPTELPAVLKDAKKPAFYRHNLALAYARALTQRRIYEDALEAFALVEPAKVVDPASYFFFRAVCEYGLLLKEPSQKSIDRLLTDVSDAPESYRSVAALMHFAMETWKDRDLAWVARMMDSIQRRLALGRGGKMTRHMQREVLVRLEEMIKEREHPPTPPGPPGPNDPGPGRIQPPNEPPQPWNPNGSGNADEKLKKTIEWIIKLPEKERATARAELLRKLPAADRVIIERYFKEITRRSTR
jgi:hypothetical protein